MGLPEEVVGDGVGDTEDFSTNQKQKLEQKFGNNWQSVPRQELLDYLHGGESEETKEVQTPEKLKASMVEASKKLKESGYDRKEAKAYIEKKAKGKDSTIELPKVYKTAIEDALTEVYGRTLWQKIIPGGR